MQEVQARRSELDGEAEAAQERLRSTEAALEDRGAAVAEAEARLEEVLAEASAAEATLSEFDEARAAAERGVAESEERRAAAEQAEGEATERLAALEARIAALAEEIAGLDAQRVTAAERLAAIQAQEVVAREREPRAAAEPRPDAGGEPGPPPDVVRAAMARAPGLGGATPDDLARLEARLLEGVCATEALVEVFGRPQPADAALPHPSPRALLRRPPGAGLPTSEVTLCDHPTDRRSGV